MDILPLILFFLGVGFIILGWRWQNPPNEESLKALKGLAYLKREMIQIQDKVHDLEGKLIESREKHIRETEHIEAMPKKEETKVVDLNPKEPEPRNIQTKDTPPRLSPKYQEVLKLAANGQGIPEISQRLVLSQDAVKMVLRMQPNGGKDC